MKDLRQEPLSARHQLLTQVLEKTPENITLSGELRDTKGELLRVAQEFGLEGLVVKRKLRSTKAAGAALPGLNLAKHI
jgi:ATP-dependent DNA ligase